MLKINVTEDEVVNGCFEIEYSQLDYKIVSDWIECEADDYDREGLIEQLGAVKGFNEKNLQEALDNCSLSYFEVFNFVENNLTKLQEFGKMFGKELILTENI